jgi:hypothetical protein
MSAEEREKTVMVEQTEEDFGEAMQLLEAERYELVSYIILPSFLVEDKRLGNLLRAIASNFWDSL